ncbi:MAG: hypothetical protein DRP54_01515 [Spirochaetes bacterium]|nr:MAG: hypothetical protein DRP54_01515 [Spirochaetota bacterium]
MPLINDYIHVKEIYNEAAEKRIALPAFNAEDRESLEAILAATSELGQEIGVNDLPIVISWTSRYPFRSQMKLLTASGNPYLGMELMLSDLRIYSSEYSPYSKLRILPHLDHAFPWIDGDMIIKYADDFASIMCDASEKSFEENVTITAKYVEKLKGKVLIEGAVDEIFESGSGEIKNELTTVEQAKEFVSKTRVDLIVPNVGTEHRSTTDKVKYYGERAREISKVVGKILCLHGVSSLDKNGLSRLPDDGFVKVNIFTTLVVKSGQGMVDFILKNLGHIFNREQLEKYIKNDILGKSVLNTNVSADDISIKPKLDYVSNNLRRDIWFKIYKETCKEFLYLLNYRGFANH